MVRRFFTAATAVLLLAARASAAVPAFTPEAGVRVSTAAPQSIVNAGGGLYRLYLIRDGFHVISASSTDQSRWVEDAGVRLSTGVTPGVDASSINACAVFPVAGGYRMLYSAGSSSGSFHLLSATSVDGLTWTKVSTVTLQVNNGLAFIGQPSVVRLSASSLRLYYVQLSTAGFAPAQTQIQSALSTDDGMSWAGEGVRLATAAFGVAVSTLTDGRARLMFSGLQAGASVPTNLVSAISSDGLAFTQEAVVLSVPTTGPQLGTVVMDRSTEAFRWRLFYSMIPSGSTIPATFSALTKTPLLTASTPGKAFNTMAATPFALTGEVFDLAPAVSLVKGGSNIPATGVTRVSDLSVTGSFPTGGLDVGSWNVVLTNGDGASTQIIGALEVDIPGGIVAIKDNLFKPKQGQQAKIDVTVFAAGTLTLKLYTLNGELVKTLFNGPVPAGTTTVNWTGDTSAGNTVASGTYLLHVKGPSTTTTKKIIVIK